MRHGIELNRTVLFFLLLLPFLLLYFSSSFMIVRKFQYPDLIISGHVVFEKKNIVDNDNEDYKNKKSYYNKRPKTVQRVCCI